MSLFLFSFQCYATETQEEVQEESYDIPGSTFYVPKSMFQTIEAYEEYCKNMYELGYMNGQFEWTDAAQAFIDDPQNIDIAEALEEDRQRVLNERVEEAQEDQTISEETAAVQTEMISETMDIPDIDIKMTEVSETEDSEVPEEKESTGIPFASLLLIALIIFFAGRFLLKNSSKKS